MNLTLRRSIAAGAVLLAPMLSSCGFEPPTDRVYTPGVGVNERSGTVDVLNALVVSGADGSGTVVVSFVNNDERRPDALTQVAGSGPDAGLSVDLGAPLQIPAGGAAKLASESPLSVEGEPITAGAFVELTFSFRRAQSVTVEVPVVARTGEFEDFPVPSVAPTSEAPEPEQPSGH